jgi:uncharacterized protein YueI
MTQTQTQRVEIYDSDRKVIIDFEVNKLILDPPMAVDMAQSMIRAAVECGYDVQIITPRPQVTSFQRAGLITRTEHIMRSLTKQKKTGLVIASQVVDSILSELL